MPPNAADPDWPVDWGRPWLAPWRESGERVALAIHGGAAFHEALNSEPGAPRLFVPQSALPAGQAYEQFIFESGSVPTRDNLHDFFNGLCWLGFPLTKARLNELQAAEIAVTGVAPLRGPVRDALTVFDENAALLSAPGPLWDALLARDWRGLFVDLRPLWQQAQLVLFGHALLEKLAYPRKPVTAHVYRAPVAIKAIADLDAWVAQDMSAEKLAGKPFTPMPVLGVPGWWPENENFSFYDDSLVFRPQKPAARIQNNR
ncbi:MAG: DUF3025 domain-containing protein [Polaromonas sp.]|uniref:DUF3025 domain-containing protein n=1 Tax=Polaromonas sp. TaxID=1869339 RepID=UPI001805E579|nr:DUF3025 domain-containing protein [Polaromonas sp.]MBA3594312.1 DUF3025 domain-containing protein [Polaromonas sp.]